jgi:hypothetical protein
MRALATFALLGALVPALGFAQAPAAPTETPEQVAQRAVELARGGEWDGFAKLMHPNDLAELKKLFREILVIDTSGQFASGLFGIENLDAYDKLDGAQVLANLMRTMTQLEPSMAEAMGSIGSETLGSVAEGPDVVHLVQRTSATVGTLTIRKMEVTSLKKFEGSWRMLAKGELQGMAETLKQVAAQQAAMAEAEVDAAAEEAPAEELTPEAAPPPER